MGTTRTRPSKPLQSVDVATVETHVLTMTRDLEAVARGAGEGELAEMLAGWLRRAAARA